MPVPAEPGFGTLSQAIATAAERFAAAGLSYGHGTDNAADEAAYLVTEALGLAFEAVEDEPEHPLAPDQQTRVAELVTARIEKRYPTAYLTGRAYIGGFAFRADPRALVPRSFIGEMLVEAIDGGGLPFLDRPPKRILELGTGSGSLAILAALAYPEAAVDAVDISPEALELAALNVADYDLAERIRLHQGDLYGPVIGRRYDLIISNPPYVDTGAMASLPLEFRHEPALGLAGGKDGLDIVRRIIAGAADHLADKGGLLCEIGIGQANLEARYPGLSFMWLATEMSDGEVFWLDAAAAAEAQKP